MKIQQRKGLHPNRHGTFLCFCIPNKMLQLASFPTRTSRLSGQPSSKPEKYARPARFLLHQALTSRMQRHSGTIAISVRFLPPPRGLQALLEISVLGCPVELPENLGRITVHFCIVTGSPVKVFDLYVHPRCLLACFDELLH